MELWRGEKKYLLLVHVKDELKRYYTCESYYGNDPDKLKEYAEFRKFDSFEIYELNKTVYSYVAAE